MKKYPRCQAATQSGNQCKNGAMHLTPFCGSHQGSPWESKDTRPSTTSWKSSDFREAISDWVPKNR